MTHPISDMNLPPEFLTRMDELLQAETPEFLSALTQPAAVSLRTHPEKVEQLLDLTQVAWATNAYHLPARPAFNWDPLLHAGCYYVQEPASMVLEQVVRQLGYADTPCNALDLCAAPGGKSTHLLSVLHPQSCLIANEVIRSRGTILKENILKWSSPRAVITANDPADFASAQIPFDLIVCDAPCSGEGLFRKDEKSISEWSPANLTLCAGRQQRILTDVLPALEIGGYLVYATCTYHPGENADIVDWLTSQCGMQRVPLSFDPSWGFEQVADDCWQSFPHRVRGEGFFIAALQKVTDQYDRSPAKSSSKRKRRSRDNQCRSCSVDEGLNERQRQVQARRAQHDLNDWFKDSSGIAFFEHGGTVAVATEQTVRVIHEAAQLNVLSIGVPTATRKQNRLIPEHGLAMSPLLNRKAFQQSELSHEQALQYLMRQPIEIEGPAGMTLVHYAGFPLGWVNQLTGRSNNRYPQSWRIRKSNSSKTKDYFSLKDRIVASTHS